MFINSDILFTWGGIAKKYKKGEFIFHDGDEARFYHQIEEGSVRMFNVNAAAKEFTQWDFQEGCSFGEPPLFINKPYPASAVATCDSIILKISKDKFLKILDEYPGLHLKFNTLFAQRIYDKALAAKEMVNNSPELRILAFLKSYKKRLNMENEKIVIPYTRQEIANYTGLRVETVIRTLSKMKTSNSVDIIERKLIF
ncbi:Crp/Fnr family transcriptional regulator [soil metagenome]